MCLLALIADPAGLPAQEGTWISKALLQELGEKRLQ